MTQSDAPPIPSIGLGTWKIDAQAAPALVRAAIEVGYRHIDCACDYGNEPAVGAGIKAALDDGLAARDRIRVTSKLWNTYHRPEHVRPACERSLRDLGLEYLDLYLIHFPIAQAFVPFETRYPPGWLPDPDAPDPTMQLERVPISETWGAMETLVDAGLVRTIGACNFGTSLLRDLMNHARIRPAALQVELHPYLAQEKLVRFCLENSIAVTAFSPLGAPSYIPLGMAQRSESILDEDAVAGAARQHGVTPAQVLLRWAVQRGTSAIPKTSKVERLSENLSVSGFALTDDQMRAITGLDRGRRFNDPGVFCEEAFNTFCPIFD